MPTEPHPAPAATLLTQTGRDGALRAALWVAWLVAELYLVAHHAVWRDEVRAFSLALSGDDVGEMLWFIHGEGHPALWYLLLRGVHAVVGTTAALPIAAFTIAAAASALVAWRAPFRPVVIALILFSAYMLFDFAVVARNYGLSLLVMAAIADRYPAHRDRGVLLGVLLALLCNTNVPSVLLAGGVLLFWAVELVGEEGWGWTARKRLWLINAAIAALGVLACLVIVFPPYNDAASLAAGADGLLPLKQLSAGLVASWAGAGVFLLILLGSLAGLARAPAALVASLFVVVGLSLFFYLVYPGLYRHQALALVFLLAMYWLVAKGRGGRWSRGGDGAVLRATNRYGAVAFAGLLGLQALMGTAFLVFTAQGEPLSRSRDLAELLRRPAFRDAIVVANPDLLLEPLSYYTSNPTWFVRERRWGKVVALTRAAKREVSLGEVLTTANALHRRTGRPVVLAMHEPLDDRRPHRFDQGYYGGFTTTPAEVRAFRSATERIARFGPVQTDETYDVYRLR